MVQALRSWTASLLYSTLLYVSQISTESLHKIGFLFNLKMFRKELLENNVAQLEFGGSELHNMLNIALLLFKQ